MKIFTEVMFLKIMIGSTFNPDPEIIGIGTMLNEVSQENYFLGPPPKQTPTLIPK